jgi:zinc protease
VYEKRIAIDVSAFQGSRELTSYFLIAATAAPGVSLADIAAAIDVELEQVIEDGPSESEMARASAQVEAQFLYRLQTNGGFGGKSDQLNAYNMLCGDPGYFATDLSRYLDATSHSVREAARHYLAFDQRMVLSVVPRGRPALALPGSELVAVS